MYRFLKKHRERLWAINLFVCPTYQFCSVVLTHMLVTLRDCCAPRGFYCASRAENPALKPLLLCDLVTNSLPISCFSHLCTSAFPSQPRRPFTRAWKFWYIFLLHSPFCPQNRNVVWMWSITDFNIQIQGSMYQNNV